MDPVILAEEIRTSIEDVGWCLREDVYKGEVVITVLYMSPNIRSPLIKNNGGRFLLYTVEEGLVWFYFEKEMKVVCEREWIKINPWRDFMIESREYSRIIEIGDCKHVI